MASHQAEIVTNYSPALGSVNLVPPEGGWEKNRQEATDPVAQAKAYERYQAQKLAGDAAAHVVKDMHVASNAENAISSESILPLPSTPIAFYSCLTTAPFPEAIFDQMRSCHNAATEFLRQYWSALLPLPAGSLGGSTPNTVPKGKEARDPVKAEKMANYLRSTERKIEAVVHTAQLSGVDPERVKAVSGFFWYFPVELMVGARADAGSGQCCSFSRVYPDRVDSMIAQEMRDFVVIFAFV